MDFFLYILSDQKEKYYIGQTNDLGRRLLEHNDKGRKSWSSKYGPWKLVHSEKYASRAEAVKTERYLKALKNRAKIRAYIASKGQGT